MKIRLKKKVIVTDKGVSDLDKRKTEALNARMVKVSTIRRKKELREEKKQALEVLPRSEPTSPATKITVSVTGNRTPAKKDSEYFKRIRKMRKFYNKQMPVLVCSGCQFQNSCPQFKAGYECAFLPFLNSHKLEDENDLVDSMKTLLEANMRRAHQATIMETLSGNTPSLELSESMNMLFQQLLGLEKRLSEKGAVNMQIETNDDSIIGKLFGNLDNLIDHTQRAQDNPIVVPHVRQLEEHTEDESPLKMFDNEVNEELIREHSKEERVN